MVRYKSPGRTLPAYLDELTDPNNSDNLAVLARSFKRALLAQNKSPQTITNYLDAVQLFGRFVRERGMPSEVHAVRGEHVEAFIAYLRSAPNKNTSKPL